MQFHKKNISHELNVGEPKICRVNEIKIENISQKISQIDIKNESIHVNQIQHWSSRKQAQKWNVTKSELSLSKSRGYQLNDYKYILGGKNKSGT